ncbi:hypothetical protein PENTCL1PPCAC_16395, partial [Pristionchus entomophagus]
HTGRSVGYLLNAAHLAATLLTWGVHMSVYGDWTDAHCTVVRPQGGNVHASLPMVSIVAEVVTISTFKRMFTRNCRLRDNIDNALTLSERYQLTENIRTLKLLTPIIWSHTLLGVIATVIFVIIKPIFPSPEQYPLVEETVSMLYLQGIFMPIIFRYRYRQDQIHEKELRTVNTTRGTTFASYHAQVITE